MTRTISTTGTFCAAFLVVALSLSIKSTKNYFLVDVAEGFSTIISRTTGASTDRNRYQRQRISRDDFPGPPSFGSLKRSMVATYNNNNDIDDDTTTKNHSNQSTTTITISQKPIRRYKSNKKEPLVAILGRPNVGTKVPAFIFSPGSLLLILTVVLIFNMIYGAFLSHYHLTYSLLSFFLLKLWHFFLDF